MAKRKQVKEITEEMYHTIFENSAVGITVADAEEKIVAWNKFAENLYNLSKKDSYQKPVHTLYPKNEWQKMRKANIRKKGMAHHFETAILKKNGETVPIDISLSVIRDDKKNIIGSVGITRDISKRKKSESDLTIALKELNFMHEKCEQNVKDRTAKLEGANLKILSLLEQKRRFINQLAHDLKTPLTPIISLLETTILAEESKKNQERLKIAFENSEYLLNLLNDILSLSKLDGQMIKFNFAQADLNKLLIQLARSQEIVLKKNKIDLILDIDKKIPSIVIDQIKIREVFENLLKNAINYLGKGNKIIVKTKSEKKKVVVQVKDEGVGIAKQELERIFEEFYKVDKSRHERSSGLGLAISKRIVEAHEGRIWVESEGVGKGSTFFIELPIKNTEAES